jgi:hypothetical protein
MHGEIGNLGIKIEEIHPQHSSKKEIQKKWRK